MNNHIASKIMRLLDRRELKENLAKLARVLSCVAVFCITYILVAPVLTEEWPAVCGMEEHVHDESCYEEQLVTPEPELICGLEEGGHVHTTDGCYTAVRGDLMCTEMGTEEAPHVHDESCYAWSYELTCTESEEGHTHTEACWAPAGEPSVQKVLICTLPEHTHTDACYHAPEENPAPEYICGFLSEHAHDDSCYFEDGSLKCTVPEHTHTDACLAPAEGEEIVTVPVDAQFTYENEMVSIAFTITGDATMRQPVTAPEAETAEETAPETEPVLELVVTEDESTDAYAEYEEIAEEEGDVMLLQVLNYGLTLNGTALDLSNCDVTVEAVPTQQLQELMDAPQDVGLMTVEASDEFGATEESNMEYRFSAYADRPGTVAYSVTQGANATFYVQYYAWMDRLVTKDGTGTALDIIDTDNGGQGTGGRLPTNPETLPQNVGDPVTYDTPSRNVYINAKGYLETQRILTPIYKRGGVETREGYPGYGTAFYEEGKGSRFSYFDAPGLQYFNMVSNVKDIQYSINTIWMQKGSNGDPASIDEKDWTVLPYKEGVTRFTNRPETAAANKDYILIEAGDVIRLIYTPKPKDEVFPADFYDYDISDGVHTTNAKGAASMMVSQNGKNFGINSGDSQSIRFGFGNKNAGTTDSLKNAKLNGKYFINTRSAVGNWKDGYTNYSFGGCTFGLVTGMNATGSDVIFNQNIVGPNLFGTNPDTTTGKTHIKEINGVQFSRVGDTYTLTAVPNTVAQNLDHFRTDSGVWNNAFWPMDSANTWGAEGHDIKFGNNEQTFNKSDSKLPTSDDKQLHNSYFGMNFAVEFELTKNYIGPLEYYFFGDDDMWAFLSEVTPMLGEDGKPLKDSNGKVKTQIVGDSQQVIDIGGVHQSVGQYVNLWDYVNTDSWEDNVRKTYRLTFFYTERGASGSTCWMQFTLPTVVGVDLESQIQDLIKEDTGTIRIEKQMGGIEGNEPFEFELKLTGADDYKIEYLYRNADGTVSTGKETEAGAAIGNNGKFKLQPGEIMVIHNLPKNTEYTITELGDSKQGYHTKIRTEVDGTVTDTKEFGGDEEAVATGSVTPGKLTSVTFINIASYELPATGGSGTAAWYLTGGMLVLLGLGLLTVHSKQKRGKAVS